MKKIARIFLGSLLRTALFTLAVTAALVATLGSPDTLKQSLNDSGVYDGLVASALETATRQPEGELPRQELDLNQQPIRQAAEAALPPKTLQSSSEQILDGVYRWLNGQVPTPDFKVDLTEAKQQFITSSAEAAETRVAGLPVCTAYDLRTMNLDADYFAITCRPPTLSPATAKHEVMDELSRNEDFLKDPVLTASTLPKNDEGQTVFEQLDQIPQRFQNVKSLPVILGLVAILLGAAIFFLHEDRRQGARSLAVIVGSTGLVLVITSVIARSISKKVISTEGVIGNSLSDNSLQGAILEALRSLSSTFNQRLLVYGVIYAALGIATFLALKFIWKPAETSSRA